MQRIIRYFRGQGPQLSSAEESESVADPTPTNSASTLVDLCFDRVEREIIDVDPTQPAAVTICAALQPPSTRVFNIREACYKRGIERLRLAEYLDNIQADPVAVEYAWKRVVEAWEEPCGAYERHRLVYHACTTLIACLNVLPECSPADLSAASLAASPLGAALGSAREWLLQRISPHQRRYGFALLFTWLTAGRPKLDVPGARAWLDKMLREATGGGGVLAMLGAEITGDTCKEVLDDLLPWQNVSAAHRRDVLRWARESPPNSKNEIEAAWRRVVKAWDTPCTGYERNWRTRQVCIGLANFVATHLAYTPFLLDARNNERALPVLDIVWSAQKWLRSHDSQKRRHGAALLLAASTNYSWSLSLDDAVNRFEEAKPLRDFIVAELPPAATMIEVLDYLLPYQEMSAARRQAMLRWAPREFWHDRFKDGRLSACGRAEILRYLGELGGANAENVISTAPNPWPGLMALGGRTARERAAQLDGVPALAWIDLGAAEVKENRAQAWQADGCRALHAASRAAYAKLVSCVTNLFECEHYSEHKSDALALFDLDHAAKSLERMVTWTGTDLHPVMLAYRLAFLAIAQPDLHDRCEKKFRILRSKETFGDSNTQKILAARNCFNHEPPWLPLEKRHQTLRWLPSWVPVEQVEALLEKWCTIPAATYLELERSQSDWVAR